MSKTVQWAYCHNCHMSHYHELQPSGMWRCPNCHAQREIRPTPLALDGGDSAASEQLSTPEVLSPSPMDSTPAHRK
jgi:hypothetical protein